MGGAARYYVEMPTGNHWDSTLYEAQHSFVWQLGRGLLDLLSAQPGERILDLGCGTGQLTAEIAGAGAETLGLDASPDMIAQARQNFPSKNHPHLRFTLAEAASMNFDSEFDAIFSNAALHWMLDTEAVARTMYRALKPGGRLVAECGGKGNIALIDSAIAAVYDRQLSKPMPVSKTIFRSISSFTSILESNGFEVRQAALFDRPTPLEGERGMENWLAQFAAWQFEPLTTPERSRAMKEVVETLRPQLYREGGWMADYRRLRVVAARV